MEPKNLSYLDRSVPLDHTLTVLDACEKGNAVFAQVSTKPVLMINAATGRSLRGESQILAQMHRAAGGYESNLVATFGQISPSGTSVNRGEHGFKYNMFSKGEDGVSVGRTIVYFNASQAVEPEKVQSMYEGTEHARAEKMLGSRAVLPAIEAKSPDPVDYLSKYLAASVLGCEFKTSPEVLADFKKTLTTHLKSEYQKKGHTQAFGDICREASKNVPEVMKNHVRNDVKVDQKVERKQRDSGIEM